MVVGMSIRLDNELVEQFEFPVRNGNADDQESLQTGPRGISTVDLQSEHEWAQLGVSLCANNLTVNYKGVEVFNQTVEFDPTPLSLVLGGRTSTANSYHHIDNVWIRTNNRVEGCVLEHHHHTPLTGRPRSDRRMADECCRVESKCSVRWRPACLDGPRTWLPTQARSSIATRSPKKCLMRSLMTAPSSQIHMNEVDLAGGGGSFPMNHPYPNGVSDDSMLDFAVRVLADVTIPAGTYTIGLGSDDGGRLQIEGVGFEQTLNSDDAASDEIRFEGTRGFDWTVGSFTVDQDLETQIVASFHERGGGDSFEIAVIEGGVLESAHPDRGWQLLADGVLGWSVTTTRRPLLSADLSAEYRIARPTQFDVNGDSGEADQLVVGNPNPDVFTTYLNIDGAQIRVKDVGVLTTGERFDIIDADQIIGSPGLTSDHGLTWDFDATTGEICLEFCAVAGDYNLDGVINAEDINLQAEAMEDTQPDLATFDDNNDGMVDESDRLIWVHDYAHDLGR